MLDRRSFPKKISHGWEVVKIFLFIVAVCVVLYFFSDIFNFLRDIAGFGYRMGITILFFPFMLFTGFDPG